MSVDAVLAGVFGQIGKRCIEILLGRGRYADLLDSAAIHQLATEYQPGAIVHLAAMYSPPSCRNPGLARKSNVEGTRIGGTILPSADNGILFNGEGVLNVEEVSRSCQELVTARWRW